MNDPIDPKYLAMADAALDAVYYSAPDIFSDVWSVIQDSGEFDMMRESVARAIEEAEEKP